MPESLASRVAPALQSRRITQEEPMRHPVLAVAALSSLALVGLPSPVRACGGCFSPPDSVSTVTDHRMVVALSDQQTTLWDQIQYSGSPRDFAWVLPTPTPPTLELATEDFFDWLDGATKPEVFAPPSAYPASGGGGFGCGEVAQSGVARAGGPDDVTVYHQGQVGPYQTVTIGSNNATDLETWLNSNGYAVPDAIKPTIAWYVSQKWVFTALRLRPDAQTSQMTPVRVRFPGLAPTFPLRMVAAGAAADLNILLWVFADQRYAAMNYDTVTLDESKLQWSTTSNKSTYRQLFAQTIADHNGRAFVTEYAQPFWSGGTTSPPQAAAGDVNVALVGQPASVTLTRLRTSLAVARLTEDLTLAPSATNQPVSNQHYLASGQVTSSPVAGALGGTRLPLAAVALALVLAARRRRARA
jgi:hypothetical protein